MDRGEPKAFPYFGLAQSGNVTQHGSGHEPKLSDVAGIFKG